MRKCWNHLLVIGFVLVTLVAGPVVLVAPAASANSDNEFTAASTVIEQKGVIGTYSLPEPPGYPPVSCQLVVNGLGVKISQWGTLQVAARAGFPSQKVDVFIMLWQRLANGSYAVANEIQLGNKATVSPGGTIFNHYWYPTAWAGPDYVVGYRIIWYAPDNLTQDGSVLVGHSVYRRTIEGSAATYPDSNTCGSLYVPVVQPVSTSGTVNSVFGYTIRRFPLNMSIPISWDGKQIGAVTTTHEGLATGSFTIPAAPMGPHTVEFKYGHWSAKTTYTVKPRIKLIPSTVGRGQTVNVSLRGYAKYETVRIRWKKGTSWVQLATVNTSGTGSANINIKVPTWAPNGMATVRGDSLNAAGGHAQTSQVTVNGGAPLTSSTVKATPSPTPSPSPTAVPATATPETVLTTVPTEQPATPEATETPTAQPTEAPSSTAVPTEEIPSPTESPILETTTVPSETPVPTTTEESV